MGAMTQAQAAEMMGVSKQHFCEIYNGVKPVTMQFAIKAERTFEVDGWELYLIDKRHQYKMMQNDTAI